jgi:hypothetical protein
MASDGSKPAESRVSDDMAGSVYIISSHGQVHNLPLASMSPRDPLNFSPARRFAALSSVTFFAIVTMTQLMSQSQLSELIEQEFNKNVRICSIQCRDAISASAEYRDTDLHW